MTLHDGSRLSKSSRGWGIAGRRRRHGSVLPALLDGTVLLVVWAALWAVFVLGVVAPAVRLTGAASPAAQVERGRT